MKSISKSQNFYPPTNDLNFLWAGLMSNLKKAFKKAQMSDCQVNKVFIFLKTHQKNFQVRSLRLNEKVSSPLVIKDEIKQIFLQLYQKDASYQGVSCHLTD